MVATGRLRSPLAIFKRASLTVSSEKQLPHATSFRIILGVSDRHRSEPAMRLSILAVVSAAMIGTFLASSASPLHGNQLALSRTTLADPFQLVDPQRSRRFGAMLASATRAEEAPPATSPAPPSNPKPQQCSLPAFRHCSSMCNGEYGTLCFPSTVCNPETHRCEKTGP